MPRTYVVMRSIHPAREAALVARMERDGWALGPPWPDDSGVARFNGGPPGWAPTRVLPPEPDLVIRTEADLGHGRRWPFAVKFCVFTLGPALLAAVVR